MEKIKNIIKNNVTKKHSKSNTKVLTKQQISIIQEGDYNEEDLKLLEEKYKCPIDSDLGGPINQCMGVNMMFPGN